MRRPASRCPNTELMTYKVVALARLRLPRRQHPQHHGPRDAQPRTSGRELGLARGANVVMPNLTPPRYRVLYEIYPDKACLRETAAECGTGVSRAIERMGRTVGAGPGPRRRRT